MESQEYKRRNCSGPPDCRRVWRGNLDRRAGAFGRKLTPDGAIGGPVGYLDSCVGTVVSDPFVMEALGLFSACKSLGVAPTLTEMHTTPCHVIAGQSALAAEFAAVERYCNASARVKAEQKSEQRAQQRRQIPASGGRRHG